ncbi:hypothetical protein [Brevibacterium aurantiacum]|uniref:Uncharacterized protein n=1 Tax=Brevibacterium aurantiacum TaxID=273384 RepID=A0A1D7W6T2_BREAU|nr:hypothetical protein [Brevibacterium aurantiacum]AOP54767.1 hypothetical protein BLSMQ_3065 [Brevibacterium aurantiacum]
MSLLFPGGILIVAGGALMDVMPGFGLGIGVLGFLLLVAWPIFAIAVNIRHGQRLKRLQKQRDFEPVSITEATPPSDDLNFRDPLHAFVTTVEQLILIIAIPVLILGGIGVFCLATLHDDPDQELFKLLAGCGALILHSMYVVFLVVGRSALMLRIAGGGLALFGLALTVGVGSELADAGGVTSTSDIVVGIASVVMVVVGVWLLFTGRNTFKRVGRP